MQKPTKKPIRAAVAQTLENLEARRMFAATLGNEQFPNTLYIEGTAGNDVISIRTRGASLQVRLNGDLQTFATRDVTRIEIQAKEGNDIADWSTIGIPTYINAGAGNDLAVGGLGNDSLTGAAGKDTLRGGPGVDRINGANSPDLLYGDEGNDVIYGGFHDDQMYGGAGNDYFFGEDGNDRMVGDAGNDRMYGNAGNDRFVGGAGRDLIDGGTGRDMAATDTTDTHAAMETVNGAPVTPTTPTTPPVDVPPNTTPIAVQARGISLNDEAIWDANFAQTMQEMKNLGVQSVRLWVGISSYGERPNAFDNVPEEDLVNNWTAGRDRKQIAGLAMKRAFELKRQGFTVMVTVDRHGGVAPTSTEEVTALYTHLVNATETPGGSTKLKDVVDFWEIGNEPDLVMYWKPSAAGKAVGIPAYVDQLLIPAATVLKGASEKVVSAGVSWNPNDLDLILKTLQDRGKLGLIDAAAYHPYGTFSQIPVRTGQAVQVAAKYGKQLVASEWNVHGFAYDNSQDAAWANAVDQTYRNTILPNFAMNFYFAMVNNQAGRGGSASSRPGGLLVHNSPITVTPSSPFEDLVTYYSSPLVRSDTFYATYEGW